MRILLLTTSFPTNKNPGSGAFVKDLYEALGKLSEVDVMVPVVSGDSVDVSSVPCEFSRRLYGEFFHVSGGIPAAIKRNPLNLLLIPWLLIKLAWQLMRVQADYDCVLANWSISGLVASISIRRKAKLLTVFRGSDINLFGKSTLARGVLRFIVKRSDYVVCVSGSLTKELEGILGQGEHKKLRCIENGIDDLFKGSPRTELFNELITVGNLTPNKGYQVLIDALAQPQLSKFGFNLRLIGDGPQKSDLQRMAHECDLDSCVEFCGLLGRHDVVNKLAESQVFVHPSFSEGRSNAVVEALAGGLVVVASDIAPNKELIDDGVNGYLFKTGDAKSLSECLVKVLSDPQASKVISENAIISIQRMRLSWDACAEKYLGLVLSEEAA